MGNDRGGILVQVVTPDAVPEHLAKSAVDIVGRARGESLPPCSDLGGSQLVDPDSAERVDGVLKSVPERLDGDLLSHVLLEVPVDERGDRGRIRIMTVTTREAS